MDNVWFLAALWVGLALVATLIAIWFGVSTALCEIVVGTVAQLVIGVALGGTGLAGQTQWITFLAGTGAIVLTFLAGAELDPSMGGLALWADSEPVLPAYVIGMVLAGTVGTDHVLIRRLRTLTFGFLTPFYFIRAGSFVSVPALVAAPECSSRCSWPRW